MGTCLTHTAHVCEAWCFVRIIKLEGFATNNRDYNVWLFSYIYFILLLELVANMCAEICVLNEKAIAYEIVRT